MYSHQKHKLLQLIVYAFTQVLPQFSPSYRKNGTFWSEKIALLDWNALQLQDEHFNRRYLLQINDTDCSLIMRYFIVDFSLLILLEYNNANPSPDLMVCSEKLSVLCSVSGRTWLPRCRHRHCCAQRQERVRTGQCLQRKRPPVSPMELSSMTSSPEQRLDVVISPSPLART